MATFSIPETLPQDLLLIRELVDKPEVSELPRSTPRDVDDDIASSNSDNDSEEEIEKDLTVHLDREDDEEFLPGSDPSSDASSNSETDSESEQELEAEGEGRATKATPPTVDLDDEDDPVPTTDTRPQTRNEIVDAELNIPDLEELGAHEDLEKVGEVVSIVDSIVIVKGLPSDYSNRGSEKALDCDTLLVFGDRKVLGYIYETFGPTSQPFYQVKFNQKYPLDPEKVAVGREVFHAPRRSYFVFVNQLNRYKGSDASNVHDEEPAEDELEFSDDEAETAHRSRLKKKRAGSRTRSAASSRHTTPMPSRMCDQDMMNIPMLNGSAYDEHGPYDLDYGANPSRPPPEPYDDPYSDVYTMTGPEVIPESPAHTNRDNENRTTPRDRGSVHTGSRARGRGRGRGRRSGTNSRGAFGRDTNHHPSVDILTASTEGYDPRMPHASLPSPYSLRQNNFSSSPTSSAGGFSTWGYANEQPGHTQDYQSHMFPNSNVQNSMFVQPHINPRFASAFGLRLALNTPAFTQGSPPPIGTLSAATPLQDWTEQWTVPVTNRPSSETGEPDS